MIFTKYAMDHARFLDEHLPQQQGSIASYFVAAPDGSSQSEHLWLKRARAPNSPLGYRLSGLLARLLRLPVLQAIPNPGGTAAIATEVQRLQQLASAGVRTPELLAYNAQGLLMRHLGEPGVPLPSLADELDVLGKQVAAGQADKPALLGVWQQGLSLLDEVHAQELYLSQAFARNMVRCPDGAIAAIDFEDDPGTVLSLPLCQLRDVLCYVHSSALYLLLADCMGAARPLWRAWLADSGRSAAFLQPLQTTLRRLHWLRHLPAERRWGRDLQRLRAAHQLLAG